MDSPPTLDNKKIAVEENKLVIAFIIIPFSIAGALIRIALQRLEVYTGAPVFGLVYAQWIGCFVMGIAVKNKTNLFYLYLPLQVGISTGLCGSITTFSSWQLGIFKEFANYAAYPHTRGKNVLSAISEFLVTLAMSLNGLVFGHHIGSWIAPFLFKSMESGTELNVIPRGFSIRYLRKYDYIVILIGVASWLGVMFAAIFAKDQKELALACVFAPFGALLRWYLSFFNGRFKGFPIGTFTANIFGTIVIAVLGLVESGVYVTAIACDVVKGLADGFCGCLTTISTFMVELTTLPIEKAYTYGFVSVVIGQCFMFVIMGSYIWSQGVNPTCV